jgi:hypothetical protein
MGKCMVRPKARNEHESEGKTITKRECQRKENEWHLGQVLIIGVMLLVPHKPFLRRCVIHGHRTLKALHPV